MCAPKLYTETRQVYNCIVLHKYLQMGNSEDSTYALYFYDHTVITDFLGVAFTCNSVL